MNLVSFCDFPKDVIVKIIMYMYEVALDDLNEELKEKYPEYTFSNQRFDVYERLTNELCFISCDTQGCDTVKAVHKGDERYGEGEEHYVKCKHFRVCAKCVQEMSAINIVYCPACNRHDHYVKNMLKANQGPRTWDKSRLYKLPKDILLKSISSIPKFSTDKYVCDSEIRIAKLETFELLTDDVRIVECNSAECDGFMGVNSKDDQIYVNCESISYCDWSEPGGIWNNNWACAACENHKYNVTYMEDDLILCEGCFDDGPFHDFEMSDSEE